MKRERISAAIESARERRDLAALLNEARILLPGTQVFLAFLSVLPFYPRFAELSPAQRAVYLCTFFGNVVALACFVVPAAYHRVARPIHEKERFKVFATKLIVLGLVPFSFSLVLATYLVCSVVSPAVAAGGSVGIGIVVVALWWIAPILRVHHRFAPQE